MLNLKRIRIDNFGLITQTDTGKLDRIFLDSSIIDKLKKNCTEELYSLSLKISRLAEYFDTEKKLIARLDVVDETAKCLTRPLRIYYGIEPKCNLQCAFCGPRDFHGLSLKASKEKEEFLLNQIAQAGSFQVQLTGGEIFLRGRNLFSTLEQTKELGLATLLGTNGVWNHIKNRKSFIRELAEFKHIIEIKVSIDGTESFHNSVRGAGTYEEAVKTLTELSEQGFTTRINTTIFRDSCKIEQIEHLALLAKTIGANLQAIPERSCGRAQGKTGYELPEPNELRAYTIRAKELREELGIGISFNFDIFGGGRQLPNFDPGRPFSCGAGLWGFAVTHLGEVYPCGFAADIGNPPIFFVGTISHETSLLELWFHSTVLERWRHAGKSPQCNACSDYGCSCWGGCMIQAYVINGTLNAHDPYCLSNP